MTEAKSDVSCVPHGRKALYLALTIPVLMLMLAVVVYLGTFGILLSLAFLACYLVMSAL